jgi:AraC-like DNA-binding protein
MSVLKLKDGFLGEKQINIPREVVVQKLSKQLFIGSLFITHIGYFPKAKFHYRERRFGCPDNILIYCVDGRGHYQTETKNYVLNANQFMILPPGKFHIYQADIHNPWSIFWVHFSGHKVKQLNNWMHIEDYEKPTDIEPSKKIIDQWSEMYNALAVDYSDKNLAFANFCLYRFLTFFICPPKFTEVAAPTNPVMESIAFMKTNISKILSVDQLASELRFSSSYYSSLFKRKTGSSPIEYFIKLKIDYGCQLLSQSNLRINEVAAKLGYDETFYFSRLFKKATGKSPRSYKNSMIRRDK